MDEQLEIRTLGGLTIKRNGKTVKGFVSRKVEALLVYLACTGRPQPRDMLAELLWEERSQTISQKDFRVALSSLNKRIASLVVSSGQAVELKLAACWLDVAELNTAIQAAQKEWVGGSSLLAGTAAQLERALALYGGDFLAGFHVRDNRAFNDWVTLERERIRQQVIEAHFYLADHFLRRNAYSAGIAQATKSLQVDPLREETYYQLMLLLSRSGQRSAALAQYETCCRVLNDELAIEPGEPITQLYEELRNGNPTISNIYDVRPSNPHNLPPQPTPFIGREAELNQIAQNLDDPGCRLLTLIGPGGIGKTRVALQAASAQVERFADGVYFVSLASINSPNLLALTIADSLSLPLDGKTTPEAKLLEYLCDKDMLLVLDNLEQLLEGTALIVQLLGRAPRLKILTTTRERLNLHEEWQIRVEGMHFPQDDLVEVPETYSAIRLFNQSARRGKAGFSLRDHLAEVIKICRQLEGVPLAIELAAAWTQVMSAEQIVQELARGLDFLATSLRNIPERHRSLRASFEVSWRLLSDTERHILMQLSVLGGGFETAAAEYVAAAPLTALMSLVEKSLIQSSPAGRFSLHEVIWRYACDKLTEAGELEQTQDRHLEFFMRLAEEAAPQLRGREQGNWLDHLELEHDNLRTALSWALKNGKTIAALRLSSALWPFWTARGYITEGRRWLDQALAGDSSGLSGLRAAAFHGAGTLAYNQGALFSAYTYFQESLAIRTAMDDAAGIAAAYNGLGLVASSKGDYAEACAFYGKSLVLRRAISSKLGLASTLNNLGLVTSNQGDFEYAQTLYRESLALERDLNDKQGIASNLNNQGALAIDQGKYDDARLYLEESLAIRRELKDKPGMAGSLYNLGLLEYSQREEDYAKAQRYFQESLAIRRELEDAAGAANTLNLLALTALYSGELEVAHSLVSESLSRFRELGYSRGIAAASNTMGNVLLEGHQTEAACSYQVESLVTFHGLADRKHTARSLRDLALIFVAQKHWEQATRLLGAAEILFETLGSQQTTGERHRYQRHVATLRTKLGETLFSTVWEDGRTMSIEQTIDLANKTIQ